MKKLNLLLVLIAFTFIGKATERIAVLNFDIVGKALTKQQFISITRTEIAKLDTFQVLDKYTVQEVVEENPVDLEKCYGVKCLTNIGQKLNVKYVVAGTAEVITDKAIITLRLIDIENKKVVKTSYSEFIWSEANSQRLIQMAVFKLFDKKIDRRFNNIYDYETVKEAALEGPEIIKYNLSGPRFGAAYQTGLMENILTNGKNSGGFNKQPFMTVIGYQMEKQYLYTGAFQAVFQMNFSLAGLDQQMAIPSIALLNGFRTSKGGWEFGFGPTFRFKKTADGFYRNGEWNLVKEAQPGEVIEKETRLDSRGEITFISSWVWAVGKSFKAGNMNIPVNFYTIPDKDGWQFGISMGYALHM
jgi:TolB-like protein